VSTTKCNLLFQLSTTINHLVVSNISTCTGEARAGGRGVQVSTVATLFSTVYRNFINDFLDVECIPAITATVHMYVVHI
jgi:hypothetical protein